MFMDNFYTRHKLAQTIYETSDNEMYTIGTIRYNNVDQNGKRLVDKADTSTFFQEEAAEFIDFSDMNPFSENDF